MTLLNCSSVMSIPDGGSRAADGFGNGRELGKMEPDGVRYRSDNGSK